MLGDYLVSLGWQAVNFTCLWLYTGAYCALLAVETGGGLEERDVGGQTITPALSGSGGVTSITLLCLY
jgi:hypothetical protein